MKRYYIIDNDISHSASLQSLLRSRKFEVKVSAGHDEAEHVFHDIQLFEPDIIICDLKFPAFDGLALIHHLQAKEETNHIPITVYTKHTNRILKEDAFNQGADHFFLKEEFPPHSLIERILKLYSRRLR
jgi:DNA-binding response OmpR family regulator